MRVHFSAHCSFEGPNNLVCSSVIQREDDRREDGLGPGGGEPGSAGVRSQSEQEKSFFNQGSITVIN